MEARIRSVLLVRLDELGVLEVLLGEAGKLLYSVTSDKAKKYKEHQELVG